ncbi:MAG: thiamine diphosphokinase, partial [Anaerorhabdus sp.]
MLKRVVIVCTLAEEMPDLSGDFYGVDKGALYLAKQGIKMKVAIGDFDSIQPNDLEKIKQYAQEI